MVGTRTSPSGCGELEGPGAACPAAGVWEQDRVPPAPPGTVPAHRLPAEPDTGRHLDSGGIAPPSATARGGHPRRHLVIVPRAEQSQTPGSTRRGSARSPGDSFPLQGGRGRSRLSDAGSPFPWSWRGTAGGAAGIRHGQVLGPSCPARAQLDPLSCMHPPTATAPASPLPKTTPAFCNPFIYRNSTLKPHLGASTALWSTAPALGAPRPPCPAAGGRTAPAPARLLPSLAAGGGRSFSGVRRMAKGVHDHSPVDMRAWPRCPNRHGAGRRNSPPPHCWSWGLVRSSHSMVSSR